MPEFIEVLKVGATWSPTALLTLVIIQILRGKLITERQHSEDREDWQRQMQARDTEITAWRDAHAKSEEVRSRVFEILATQTNDLRTVLLYIQGRTEQ